MNEKNDNEKKSERNTMVDTNLDEQKGLVFKNIEQCRNFRENIWKTGVLSICVGIVLATLCSFNIVCIDILNAITVLTFILSTFLFFYSNFELNLFRSAIRCKMALKKGKCLRTSCMSNFSKCIDLYESGYWVCVYYQYENKDELNKFLEEIIDMEKESNENKNSV